VERRALIAASAAGLAVLSGFLALIFVDGMPLHGPGLPRLPDGRVIVHHAVDVLPADSVAAVAPDDVLAKRPLTVVETPARGRLIESPGDRWSHVIVPMIFFTFLIPGLLYGRLTGAWRTQREALDGIYHGIRAIVPVLVIAFFMAQFVNYFAYTRLDRMLAHAGGAALVAADLPVPVLLVLFVLLVIAADFALSGMLSKFGVMAPIFIPMFMFVGMSPELTTAAYRIGDSAVNVVTPLNSYMLVIIAVLQKYDPRAGLGSLIALMIPYSVLLFLAWTAFLLGYWWLGVPLGPGAPLTFAP
jgi:aminobenzoyl-glutamate transport protein